MRFLARRRRCSCGCGGPPPGVLDVIRGFRLIAFLCWESICIFAKRTWQSFNQWRSRLSEAASERQSSRKAWKCDLCGMEGMGDAFSFFGLEEIEHFMESRCKGSLRLYVPPELPYLVPVASDLFRHNTRVVLPGFCTTFTNKAVAAFSQAENKSSMQDATTCLSNATTTCLSNTTTSVSQGMTAIGPNSIALGCDAVCCDVNLGLDARIRAKLNRLNITSDMLSKFARDAELMPDRDAELMPDREFILGLGSTWVEAGQSLCINTVAGRSLKVHRLVVPSSVAPHFMINGLTIKSRQLLVSGYPAIMFDESTKILFSGVADRFDVISVSVTNMSRRGKWFQRALLATVLDEMPSGGASIADRELRELVGPPGKMKS